MRQLLLVAITINALLQPCAHAADHPKPRDERLKVELFVLGPSGGSSPRLPTSSHQPASRSTRRAASSSRKATRTFGPRVTMAQTPIAS